MKKIAFIGPNSENCSDQLYDFGVELGRAVATADTIIICGGRGGFMEAVCRGAKESAGTFKGQTLGILPEATAESANRWVDVTIPTGMGLARNAIIVNSGDIIVAAGGGTGTLSELAFACQMGKKVLCITTFDGWAARLAAADVDAISPGLLIPVATIEEILGHL